MRMSHIIRSMKFLKTHIVSKRAVEKARIKKRELSTLYSALIDTSLYKNNAARFYGKIHVNIGSCNW